MIRRIAAMLFVKYGLLFRKDEFRVAKRRKAVDSGHVYKDKQLKVMRS